VLDDQLWGQSQDSEPEKAQASNTCMKNDVDVVCDCTGAEATEIGQQQPANIPLIPPPKQPTIPASLTGVPGQTSQAAAAKPKSKKVCMIQFQFLE